MGYKHPASYSLAHGLLHSGPLTTVLDFLTLVLLCQPTGSDTPLAPCSISAAVTTTCLNVVDSLSPQVCAMSLLLAIYIRLAIARYISHALDRNFMFLRCDGHFMFYKPCTGQEDLGHVQFSLVHYRAE
jgi:hypothetical protein